jgi:hypothetical protein
MEEELTVKDVLEKAVDIIEGISVPVSLGEQITRPLCHAASLIRSCLEAFEQPEGPAEVKEDV